MLGSEFVARYGRAGLPAWEAAALQLARDEQLCPWPWVDLALADDGGHTAVLKVQSDLVAVGTLEDHVRLPLLPSTAQSVANLSGSLLPTPWLAYQIWRAAEHKLEPQPMVPNLGANANQYAAHSALVDGMLADAGAKVGQLVAGIGKHVVVSNILLPGRVVIFGWYRPSPPAPDAFDDRTAMTNPSRQPVQPLSNVHSSGYVDYSHGIQLVGPTCVVDGQPTATLDLYQHPTLSRLVSNEGPVRFPRYAQGVVVPPQAPAATLPGGFPAVSLPGLSEAPASVSGRRNW